MKTNTATVPLSATQLRQAADMAEQIETLTNNLDALMNGGIVAGDNTAPKGKGKRKFSAATRAKIAAGQKARWAKRHAAQTAGTPPAVVPATAV